MGLRSTPDRPEEEVIKLDFGDIYVTVEAHVKGFQRPIVHWTIGPVIPQEGAPLASSTTTRRVTSVADLVLTADQQVPVSVSGRDSDNNPTTLTGTPVFSVDDSGVLSVTDNGDGTAVVVTAGPTGSGLVSVHDQETNGDEFVGSLAIDVVAGAVKSVSLTAGEPQAQG